MTIDGEVQLWHAALDAPDVSPDVLSWLSPSEVDRARRLRFDRDRRRFIAAHGFLRALLARHVGCHPRNVSLRRAPAGKPQLAEGAVRFNLAHSGELALVALASEREVGADVELVRPLRSPNSLARRVLSPGELAELERTSAAPASALLVGWTRKEAVLKACGQGLRREPGSVEVGISASAAARTVSLGDATTWSVVSQAVAPGYVAAVAAEGKGLKPRSRAWTW